MPAPDDLIATYLDQLRRELQASPQEEQEILSEVRSHLLLAAQEAGDRAAVERFGSVRHVGQELRQVHGRATWQETALAALPLVIQAVAFALPAAWEWLGLFATALPLVALILALWIGRTRWPLWGWVWLGSLPLLVPRTMDNPLWGALVYLVLLLCVYRRNWLEATLSLYLLPTAWAFYHTVLASAEVRRVGWSTGGIWILGLGMAAVWVMLLVRILRTPSGRARILRALESQAILFLLNTLLIAAARLWPTYPSPYPFTLRYFVLITLPYGLYQALPYFLFTVITSLPAIMALLQAQTRRQPPSRPVWN